MKNIKHNDKRDMKENQFTTLEAQLNRHYKQTSKSTWYNVWLRAKDGVSLEVTDKLYYDKVECDYYHVVSANCRIEQPQEAPPITMYRTDICTYAELEALWQLLQRIKNKAQKHIRV